MQGEPSITINLKTMYYEEKLIDGVWCHRSSPRAEYKPMNSAKLNNKINKLILAADKAYDKGYEQGMEDAK